MRAFDQRFASVYNDLSRFPSLDHVAVEMGLSVKTVRNRAGEMRSLIDAPELISRMGTGRVVTPPTASSEDIPEFRHRSLIKAKRIDPRKNRTRYFILSSAQDESSVHEGFLNNLIAYSKWLGDCELMIAGFTYNKSVYEEGQSRASGKKSNPIHFHESLKSYLVSDQIELGAGLVYCAEMNTLPTATRPLSGFETYTRDKWGIFPHAKIQLESIPTMKMARTKILMTTGAVTLPNYVQKKAGIKASFHHQLGAVLVELMADGTFFCRHLQATSVDEEGGDFYDLDRYISNAEVTTGHRVEAINYGDIHHEKLDPEVALSTWGYDVENGTVITKNNLVEYLNPKHQFFHDLSDFSPKNHHNISDAHFLFKTHTDGDDNVEKALQGCALFLDRTKRPGTRSAVITSNHDNALLRWLKTAEYREDQTNALFFLEAQLSYYRQLADRVDSPAIFEQVLRGFLIDELADIIFVNEDDSYEIADGIECGMHGHLGANGSRGNPRQYAKFGKRSNTGHTHSAQIIDGAYVAGVSGKLDMGYNRGPSSWSQSHILTYETGQRCILTMMNGRWYAPRKNVR